MNVKRMLWGGILPAVIFGVSACDSKKAPGGARESAPVAEDTVVVENVKLPGSTAKAETETKMPVDKKPATKKSVGVAISPEVKPSELEAAIEKTQKVLESTKAIEAPAERPAKFTNVEQALVVAKAEGKDVLINFTGSDWCGWCIKLHSEVFSKPEWKRDGLAKYVVVELDFPQKKPLSAEQMKYNREQQAKYGVQGFPTLYLMDSDGNIYARASYKQGGAVKYIAYLDEMGGNKRALKTALEFEGEKTEKLAKLLELHDSLKKSGVEMHYRNLRETIVKLDKDNTSGRIAEIASQLVMDYVIADNTQKAGEYLELVSKLAPEQAKVLSAQIKMNPIMKLLDAGKIEEAKKQLAEMLTSEPKGDVAQNANYMLAIIAYREKDKAKAISYMEAAIEASPASKAVAQLKNTLSQLKGQ